MWHMYLVLSVKKLNLSNSAQKQWQPRDHKSHLTSISPNQEYLMAKNGLNHHRDNHLEQTATPKDF